MRCRECEASLWGYIDGELPEDRRRLIDAHLTDCARCALALERIRDFPLRAGALSVATPPPDFTARLMRRIEPLPPPRELLLPTPMPLPFRGPLGAAVAFASAAAALVLGLISTSALALLSGQSLAGPILRVQEPWNGGIVFDATNLWRLGAALAGVWMFFSWPVLAALAGMLVVLALLWFRLVSPRRALDRRR